jgi:hypothetical protein
MVPAVQTNALPSDILYNGQWLALLCLAVCGNKYHCRLAMVLLPSIRGRELFTAPSLFN